MRLFLLSLCGLLLFACADLRSTGGADADAYTDTEAATPPPPAARSKRLEGLGFGSVTEKIAPTESRAVAEEPPAAGRSFVVRHPDDADLPTSYDAPTPDAGQLTAGEWNDLEHWDFWEETTRGEYNAIREAWHLQPQGRYTVLLTDAQERPLIDVRVELLQGDEVIWQSRTDNVGKAECWAGLRTNPVTTALRLRARYADEYYYLPAAAAFGQGSNTLQLPVACRELRTADVKFVVDATGSMGDEIAYLRAELSNVIERAAAETEDIDFRVGTVFYRDAEDEYLTRYSPLTTNLRQTVGFINKQNAAGGGDFPEAVTPALEKAINDADWSAEAVARILFLVLDAPPHNNPDTQKRLARVIQQAAAKGIRIVPVTASGIDRATEYLMKAFGLATNGTYVFLTDHSGIGGKHLDPVVQNYDVEKLNSLLVRLLTQYTALPDCSAPVVQQAPEVTPPGERPAWAQGVVISPNPASTFFHVELPGAVDDLLLFDPLGRQVRRLTNLQEGRIRFNTGDLPSGWYTVRLRKGQEVVTERVLVSQV